MEVKCVTTGILMSDRLLFTYIYNFKMKEDDTDGHGRKIGG
jgi:hypothetical protein